MNIDQSEMLRKNLLEAASLLLEHGQGRGHSMMEVLPGGARLAIEIEILPPLAEFSGTALRVLPSPQNQRKRGT